MRHLFAKLREKDDSNSHILCEFSPAIGVQIFRVIPSYQLEKHSNGNMLKPTNAQKLSEQSVNWLIDFYTHTDDTLFVTFMVYAW